VIVVDASAAVLGLLHGGDARDRLAGEDVHVPHLVDSEVAHALRGQVRRDRVPASDARAALMQWQRLGVRRYPALGLLSRIWALRDNVSAYDATYVALAESLGCPLLTADARLAGSPGIRCQIVTVRS
jgi:predicted nucleic acid-binding protein